MNIGIIVHSLTGHTYYVAEKLKDKLLIAGHSVNIEKLDPIEDKEMDVKKVQIKSIPDVYKYDALVFAAPVRAFSLSPIIASFLSNLTTLQGKKAVCFVTMSFPFKWLGGNKAISKMITICKSKGILVSGSGIVNWSGGKREGMIAALVDNLSSLF